MGFKEDFQRLSAQANERRRYITNEETAKQALIIPFLQVLGFDVFNPLEVKPEYVADFGKKKGEKVDYAIFKENTPIMFIEAKSPTEKLENHDAQLARYFNSTPEVKFAVLTNGIEYKFFTDLNSNNIMDETPFLYIDITNLSDADIEALAKFRKEEFQKDALINFAEELIYTSNIVRRLEDLFKNPSDEFVRFLIKPVSESRITTSVVERFRPIVKKSISTVILKMVSQGLFPPEEPPAEQQPSEMPETTELESSKKEPQKEPHTTEEELNAFAIVKEMLQKAGKDVSSLAYKDTINYFAIYNRVITDWMLRLFLEGQKRNVIVRLPITRVSQLCPKYEITEPPKGHGEGEASRIYINSLDDLRQLEKVIVECFESIVGVSGLTP